MQKGRVYIHGKHWWFHFKVPEITPTGKVWRNRYVKLAPASQYPSALAVEKAGLVLPYRATLTTTPSTAQTLTEFVERVYFPSKNGSLKASTLVGYRNVWAHHLRPPTTFGLKVPGPITQLFGFNGLS